MLSICALPALEHAFNIGRSGLLECKVSSNNTGTLECGISTRGILTFKYSYVVAGCQLYHAETVGACFFSFISPFFFISWRLITSQYLVVCVIH